MGYYAEYLDQKLSFNDLTTLRKEQLKKISELRQRDVLVFASDLNKGQAPISITYEDLTPLNDQLSNLGNGDVDLIIETPGGQGEIAEAIVRALHNQFNEVGVIIPGSAMSAGTIIAMSGDEILMHRQQSSLGPIDAQLFHNGKRFSAHAFLEGIENIKGEAVVSLNRAYIPILQTISPGEIEHAKNAQAFSRQLVTDWLAQYKFRNWQVHSSNGQPVTEDDKKQRAEEIASELCNHGKWKTHGRRIMLEDLESLRLKVTDYSADPALSEAIERYFVLLQMAFNATTMYKLYETPVSQIYKHHMQGGVENAPVAAPAQQTMAAELDVKCECGTISVIQANLGNSEAPIKEGSFPYPANDVFTCPNCGREHDLSTYRLQVEAQAGMKVIK